MGASRASRNVIYSKMGKKSLVSAPLESKSAKRTAKRKTVRKSYAPKMARAGKDLGKKGKNFSKIATSAAKKYGSKSAGKRVAGAVLANLRAKGYKK